MIELYTTNNCQYCGVVKIILKESGVDYTEYNLSDPNNNDKKEEIMALTGMRKVPVLRNGDKFTVGADESEILKLVKVDNS